MEEWEKQRLASLLDEHGKLKDAEIHTVSFDKFMEKLEQHGFRRTHHYTEKYHDVRSYRLGELHIILKKTKKRRYIAIHRDVIDNNLHRATTLFGKDMEIAKRILE